MTRNDKAIEATSRAMQSDNVWLRILATRNLNEIVGESTKAMREGRELACSPEPPLEPDWAERREVRRILNAGAVLFSLIFILYVLPTCLGWVNAQESKVVGVGR